MTHTTYPTTEMPNLYKQVITKVTSKGTVSVLQKLDYIALLLHYTVYHVLIQ